MTKQEEAPKISSIEEMIDEIVTQTISAKDNLEKAHAELEQQQAETLKLSEAISALSDIESTISTAAERLSSAEELLMKGEYGKTLARIDEDATIRAEESKAITNTLESCSNSNKAVQSMITEFASTQANTISQFEETVIDAKNAINSTLEKRKQEHKEILLVLAKQAESITNLEEKTLLLEAKLDMLLPLLSSIESLSARIDRIDTNTQKGFGKVKG